MAKAPAKSVPKKLSAKPKAKVIAVNIEQITKEALAKLKTLNIEHSLQADIDWCLGSYRADNNPIGLYDMISRALSVFKAEFKKKTKGVTAKLIEDIEKTLAAR